MMLKTVTNWLTNRVRRGRKMTPLLPRRWRLQLEALEERTIPTATPSAALVAPATNFLGQDVNLSVSFTNTGTTVGYGPYLDLYLPATGADGPSGPTHYDGITYNAGSATYLGVPVTTTLLTFNAAGKATHPYAKTNTGAAVVVNGTPGDQLVVFQLPFGSFTPGQVPAAISLTAHVSNLANVGTALTLKTDAGFQYGNDALDNPTTDPTILGATTTQTVTPTLFNVTKTYVGPEDETATGPNFPRQYKIDVSVASGQTVTNLDVTDALPNNLQFVRVDSTTIKGVAAATTALSTPSTSVPGGTLTRRFASVTGTGGAADAEVVFTFYVPEKDAAGNPVLNLTTGAFATSTDTASARGSWTPIDAFDTGGTVTSNTATHVLTDKSIAIQKGVIDQIDTGAAGPTPGDTLEYTLNVQISDYFAFQNLVAQDTFSDGQKLDGSFTPTLSVNGDTFALGTANFNAGNFGLAFGTFDPVTGGNVVSFDLSKELVARGRANGQLLGGAVPTAGTGGAIPPANPAFGPTTATITFRTKILDKFNVLTAPSGDPFVKQGDLLNDAVKVNGDVLNYADLTPDGNSRTDNSAASVQIVRGALTKILYAINGVVAVDPNAGYASGVAIAAGDQLTYRLRDTLSSGDAETLALTDFLPLPVLKATTVSTFDAGGPTAAAPAVGHAVLGPTDTLTAHVGAKPTIVTDATANSVKFAYPTFNDAQNRPALIDILFTVAVSSDPFADGLFLTNEVHESEGSTNNGGSQADAIIQFKLTEPLLKITKGAVSTNDAAAAFAPVIVGPVPFNAPGTATSFAAGNTVTSNGLAAKPIKSALNNIQAGDLVRFAVVVENTGTGLHGAFDVTVKDTLPAGFTQPAGGFKFIVTDGTGTVLSFGNAGGGTGLFDKGIVVTDPNPGAGAIGAFNATSGKNILVITYDLLAQTSVQPRDVLTNTATLTNYATAPGAPDFIPGGLTATTTVSVESPVVTKQLVSTSIVSANNDNTHAVIGEKATYQVTVTIPQGTMTAAVLKDTLPAGLAFVSFGGFVSSDPAHVTITGTASPDVPTLTASNGQTVQFNLGTLTNTDTDNTVAETLTFTYTTVVLDVASNTNGKTLTNSALLSWNGKALNPVSDSTLKVIEPKLQVVKTSSNGGGQFGTTVTYTLVVKHDPASVTDAFDVALGDVLPADVTFVPGSLVFSSGTAPDVGTLKYTAGTRTVSANYASFPLAATSTLTFQVTLDQTVTPGEQIVNTGRATFTSTPGNPGQVSPYNAASTERTGAGGVDNYVTTGSNTVTVNLPAPVKSIVGTSEASTAGTNVAVGEVVRYRLKTTLPQGTAPNFQLVDNIPAGVRFLNDGKVKLAFVSDLASGGTVTSSDATIGTGPDVQGDQTTVDTITPGFTLPAGAVSGGAGDGAAVTFSLGQLVNNEHDAKGQFVLLEFDALVDNAAADVTGASLVNNYVVDVSGGQSGPKSNNVPVAVVEPKINNLTKTASAATGDAGDVVTYTLTFSNSGTATAFDLDLIDNLPASFLQLNAASVTSAVPGTTTVTNKTTGNTVELVLDQLAAGGSVTVTYTAVLTNAVTPALALKNTANLTFTSLPGTNGTTPNPLGTNAPGAPGAADGERTGSGVGLNNYLGSGSATVTVTAPGPLVKTIVAVSVPLVGNDPAHPTVQGVAVGELVTYDATFTLSEATFATLKLTDALPAGLTAVSSRIVSIGGNTTAGAKAGGPISGSPLGVGTAGTVAGSNVTFDFGGLANAGDNVVDATDNIVVEVVAQVTNVVGNKSGTMLTNQVTLDYGTGTLTASVPLEVVEPKLTVTKTTSSPRVDAETAFTYTVVVSNAAANGSTAPAFALNLTDPLPAGESLIAGSVTTTAGTVTTGNGAGDTSVGVADPELDLGNSVTITYRVKVNGPPTAGAVAPGNALVNTATVTENSLPTGNGGGRPGTVTGSSTVTVNTNTITGFVYLDPNDNGTKDSLEPGLLGVGLTLTGKDSLGNAVNLPATTDNTGAYSFALLRPSDASGYTITKTPPAGYLDGKNQAGNAGNPFGGVAGAVGVDTITTIVIPANSNQTQPNFNFGELQPTSVAGTVYDDKDGSGSLTGADAGIGGVALTLTGKDDVGNLVNVPATTSGTGAYSFTGLRPSDVNGYTVTETQPGGYLQATNTVGTVGGTTDGALAPVDKIGSVFLTSGQAGVGYNFGEVKPVSIIGTVYDDKDGSGSLTGADAGIGGVALTLTGKDDQGNVVNVPATTSGIGAYSFTGLRPSDTNGYTVTETQPGGYLQAVNTVGTVGGSADGSLVPVDKIGTVVVTSGQSGIGYNFGEVKPVSVVGTVYDDKDGSGSLTGADADIGGVALTLTGKDDQGNVVNVPATTSGTGAYSFTALRPSDSSGYTVTETQPGGYLQAVNTVGTVNGTTDGALVPVDEIGTVVLTSGQNGISYNFGEVKAVSISGTVYDDKDASGSLTGADAGIGGVALSLTGKDDQGNAVNVPATTSGTGAYTFAGLRPSDSNGYTVTETQPASYLQATNTVGTVGGTTDGALVPVDKIGTVVVTSGQSGIGYNFGEVKAVTIAGTVYDDKDGSGSLTGADAGIGGVALTLTGKDDQGTVVNVPATTSGTGAYSFTALRPSDSSGYTVTETQPGGYLQAVNTVGTVNGTTDGALVPVDKIGTVVLTSGQNGISYNFGEVKAVSISGTVYDDKDASGSLTGADAGIGDVALTLTGKDDQGTAVNVPATTLGTGAYSFTGLRPSDNNGYTVTETQPGGYLQSVNAVGTVSGSADGALVPVDQIGSVNLTSGQGGVGYNFGEVKAVSIVGTVYDDKDGSGSLTGADAGIGGVTVTLTEAGGTTVATATTTGTGAYSFTTTTAGQPLPPGTYTVVESQPAGYLQGVNTVGTVGGSADGSLVPVDKIGTVVLTSGQNGVGYNFGEVQAVTIAGTVYDDKDGSGSLTGADAGISSVALTLTGKDDQGNAVNVPATTSATGTYSFTGLRPSDSNGYTVTETQPGGYLQAVNTVGTVNGNADGALVPVDKIGSVVLTSGQAGVGYDFGEVKPATISGVVYHDANNNGSPDGTEAPLVGVMLTLSGTDDRNQPVNGTAFTDNTGAYSIPGLRPGTYQITEAQPAGYFDGLDAKGGVVIPGSNTTDVVTGIALGSGTIATGNNFGELQPSSVAGVVFDDLNDNGVQDGVEIGIANTAVTLTGTNDLDTAFTLTAFTNNAGQYSFPNLRPSTGVGYTVTETQPPVFLQGTNTVGSAAGVPGATDQFTGIVIPSGTTATGYNFAELEPGGLAGFVYLDTPNNGTHTRSSPGIANTMVALTGTDDHNTAVRLTTPTLADGSYSFANLRPGTYTLSETQPAGYLDGKDTLGTPGGTATNDQFSTIALHAGVAGANNNFGELLPANLTGFVYLDANGSGVRDPGDYPLPRITVVLTGTDDLGTSVNQSLPTDGNGAYNFPNLRPGSYTAGVVQSAFTPGIVNVGSAGGAVANGQIASVVLNSGVSAINNNFGERGTTLTGRVLIDGGPVGLGGVTIKLRDAGGNVFTTTTAADGSYAYSNMAVGAYTVTETLPNGYGIGSPTVLNDNVPLAGLTNQNFIVTTSSLAGTVFFDNNNDSLLNGPDAGLGGVLVTLTGKDANGTAVGRTTTAAADGTYRFAGLLAGTYTVQAAPPANAFDGKDTAGGAGGVVGRNTVASINLGGGVATTGYNFPFVPQRTLAGTVFMDNNNTGTDDPGDPGIPGVLVTLTGTNVLGTPVSWTTTTNAVGAYQFIGLAPGAYTVTETPPIGYDPGKPQPGVPAPAQSLQGRFVNVDLRLAAFVSLHYNFPHLSGNFAISLMTSSIAAPETFPTFVSKVQLLGSQAQINADTGFVNNLFQQVLGRPVDADGVNYWVFQLESGTARQDVANAIWTSAEHRGEQVDQLYRHFLHRNPEVSGRAYWVNLLLNGANETDLPRLFLTSQEYQLSHPDATSFVQSLYEEVLGRASEASGLAYWQQQLNGGATRDDVLRGFLGSQESALQVLDQYYARYLRRPADAAAEAAWMQPLETWNLAATTVASMILSSDEFYNRPVGG